MEDKNKQELALVAEVDRLKAIPVSEILTAEQFVSGVELLRELKGKETFVHSLWDEDIKTANDLHKSLTGKRKKFLDAIASVSAKVDLALDAYRKRDKEKQEAEQRRIAEEQRVKQQAALVEEAADLERAGDEEGAESVLAEAMNTPAPVVVLPSSVPHVNGSYSRTNWKFRITDQAKIQRDYLIPDESLIGSIVRKKGKLAEQIIAGIEVWDTSKTVTKG